jgi:hypothetical protein
LRLGQANLHPTQVSPQPKQSYPTLGDFEIHHRGRHRERRSELVSVKPNPHEEKIPTRYAVTVAEDYTNDGYGYTNSQGFVRNDLFTTSGLGNTTHNLDGSRLGRQPSLPTHVESRSSSEGRIIEVQRGRARSTERDAFQHSRPPSHDAPRAQGSEAGQVEKPHDEQLEESTIESTEKLQIFKGL